MLFFVKKNSTPDSQYLTYQNSLFVCTRALLYCIVTEESIWRIQMQASTFPWTMWSALQKTKQKDYWSEALLHIRLGRLVATARNVNLALSKSILKPKPIYIISMHRNIVLLTLWCYTVCLFSH